eukprot:8662358-Pyramimonas_sp.AAC.1
MSCCAVASPIMRPVASYTGHFWWAVHFQIRWNGVSVSSWQRGHMPSVMPLVCSNTRAFGHRRRRREERGGGGEGGGGGVLLYSTSTR